LEYFTGQGLVNFVGNYFRDNHQELHFTFFDFVTKGPIINDVQGRASKRNPASGITTEGSSVGIISLITGTYLDILNTSTVTVKL